MKKFVEPRAKKGKKEKKKERGPDSFAQGVGVSICPR
jgi:hypothetical protein